MFLLCGFTKDCVALSLTLLFAISSDSLDDFQLSDILAVSFMLTTAKEPGKIYLDVLLEIKPHRGCRDFPSESSQVS